MAALSWMLIVAAIGALGLAAVVGIVLAVAMSKK